MGTGVAKPELHFIDFVQTYFKPGFPAFFYIIQLGIALSFLLLPVPEFLSKL